MGNTTFSTMNFDAQAQNYWRVRIAQLKQELRDEESRPSIRVDESPRRTISAKG
ncbi:MAG: hypothetical protein QNJ46_10835 [Leptolyngbyaceae cyanobacterium MO_188.B28]|nr:hypothetical protein [Leptolyngbyaceae cyanobacterium MO_188.B28]